jgi:hypothetical protein
LQKRRRGESRAEAQIAGLRQVGDLLRRQLDDRDLPMIDKPTPPLPADLDRRGGPTPPGAASFRDEPVVDWNPDLEQVPQG